MDKALTFDDWPDSDDQVFAYITVADKCNLMIPTILPLAGSFLLWYRIEKFVMEKCGKIQILRKLKITPNRRLLEPRKQEAAARLHGFSSGTLSHTVLGFISIGFGPYFAFTLAPAMAQCANDRGFPPMTSFLHLNELEGNSVVCVCFPHLLGTYGKSLKIIMALNLSLINHFSKVLCTGRAFIACKYHAGNILSNLRALQPDLCVTAAYGNILPSTFLKIPLLAYT
ncbi:hypothetical protein NE237_021792 [Protea cynaroides]|uniref:Uncharacterized protein n=1 Tax=Protea cynaroides TaxID=273540 RepID=A0A9Q0H8L9_9MAGN|nr:hypothetical protein NE237_021792 [Protea cynaroides]